MQPEFEKELAQLNERASASRISNLTKLAMANIKSYKEIVFALEKYMQKASNKLSGMYLIDSICRASLKLQTPSVYVKRVSEKLEQMMVFFMQSPEKEKEKMKRLIVLWKDNNVFPADLMDAISGAYFGLGSHSNNDVTLLKTQINPPSGQSISTVDSPTKNSGASADKGSTSIKTIEKETRSQQQNATPSNGSLGLLSTGFSAPESQAFSPKNHSQTNLAYPMTPTVGVGSLLSSVIHGASQAVNIPTMDQLNSMLNIPAPSAPVVTRDPSQFDYEDDDELEFVSRRKSLEMSRSNSSGKPSNILADLLKTPNNKNDNNENGSTITNHKKRTANSQLESEVSLSSKKNKS